MHLQGATQYERVEEVASFVGEDASGSFGILAGHGRTITVLEYGLARYRTADGPWTYVALPGGVLYFTANELFISTRRYLRDTNYDRVSAALVSQLLSEERQLAKTKESLARLEKEMFRRLREVARSGP